MHKEMKKTSYNFHFFSPPFSWIHNFGLL